LHLVEVQINASYDSHVDVKDQIIYECDLKPMDGIQIRSGSSHMLKVDTCSKYEVMSSSMQDQCGKQLMDESSS
jgi:hypothetical protein